MKKINLLLLSLLTISLAACNKNNNSSSTPSIFNSSSSVTKLPTEIIEEDDSLPLMLWYDEEAPAINECSAECNMDWGADLGWQNWSLPLGNGYFGVNVFGRTETERIQITEKTLSNPWIISGQQKGGLNNFSETYIDFNHANNQISDYIRYLNIKEAVAGVSYDYDGVTYTREYFTSYPDKALVIYLDASEDGALDFTLRPTIPFEQDYMVNIGDGAFKEGEVGSYVENNEGFVELYGKLGYYDVDFYGLYHVYTEGGTVSADTTEHKYKDSSGATRIDTDGTIVVEGATKAYIVVNLATDYELSSDIFTTGDGSKPTIYTSWEDTMLKVEDYHDSIEEITSNMNVEEAYKTLKDRHINDYKELFGRVMLDLNSDELDINITTDELLKKYKYAKYSSYLETLMFQYGRYMLIASSRSGALPANLQGAWNAYNIPPWSSGYWNNINVQMNYWPAFSTNIAETFESYIELNDAYMKQAEKNATDLVSWFNPDVLNDDGGNGWTIGVASNPFFINSDRSSGNMCFTTQLYWDYYQYTQDEEILKKVYEVLANAARYVTKCVKEDENGFYLVESCDSPEQWVNGEWYYTTGTTYAQSFAYLNNYYTLQAAIELGIDIEDNKLLSSSDYAILKTIMNQLDKYDPINIGLSGQIKEFREEDYYGSLGDPNHRHISQLVGLYPGNLINSTTPAWMDAAAVTLKGRENFTEPYGWVYAHKMNLYARLKDGTKAHENLNKLINKTVSNNLWTIYKNCFQVEAGFGATAGISEMLLQSHEGYIEPLAAIPSKWSDGAYSGLVARGNFEVSVEWKNSVAKKITLLSEAGKEAKVSYPSIADAKVLDSSGNSINYKILGDNLISFETKVDEKYTITGLKNIEKIEKPKAISLETKDSKELEFSWTEVSNAQKYNIYKAIGNSSSYEFIGSSQTTSFTYKQNSNEENMRTTFCVTAVDSSLNESDRTLTYLNPLSKDMKINNFSYLINNNDLEVSIEAVGSISSYRLYEKENTSGSYILVKESKFPIISIGSYNESSNYAITIVSSYDGRESEKYWINTISNDNNILNGKQFSPTSDANNQIWDSNYSYSNLTDGIFGEFEGRFSTKYNSMVDATIDLGGTYTLTDIKIYDYAKDVNYVGATLEIQVYHNGVWQTVINCTSNAEISNHRINNLNGYSWIEFDLNNIEAEKVRIYISSTIPNYTISLYEIECRGF